MIDFNSIQRSRIPISVFERKTLPKFIYFLDIDAIRINRFFQSRQAKEDLFQATLFIQNLERLKNSKNPDGTKIIGVERIFENTEERISKGENLSGHYFEANLGVALINAGFKIKEVSAKKSLDDTPSNPKQYIQRREVDFVVIKDNIKYYVEAKVHIGRLIESDKKNKKTDFLVNISKKYGAVPVIILNSLEMAYPEDHDPQDLMQKDFSEHDKRQILKYLEKHPELKFWKVPDQRFTVIEDLNIINPRESERLDGLKKA